MSVSLETDKTQRHADTHNKKTHNGKSQLTVDGKFPGVLYCTCNATFFSYCRVLRPEIFNLISILDFPPWIFKPYCKILEQHQPVLNLWRRNVFVRFFTFCKLVKTLLIRKCLWMIYNTCMWDFLTHCDCQILWLRPLHCVLQTLTETQDKCTYHRCNTLRLCLM